MPEARPETLLDIRSTRQALTSGQISPADLLALAQGTANGRGCRHVYTPASPSRPAETVPGPLSGIAVSVKDLFDVAGQSTKAGSKVLDNAAADADCPAVARLRSAGATLAGRTNMVEFAFSGVGINPHYGTPVNPSDTAVDRIPGGSSSGEAVSVATGATWAGLGSDIGGSVRIPAALCGIVGFKSTARLVPTLGAVSLSTSLDTVCALTRSVRDAVTVHEVLAARSVKLPHKPLAVCRFAIARTLMQDGLDRTVTSALERSLKVLRSAGAQIEELHLAEISELAAINATGGLSAAES